MEKKEKTCNLSDLSEGIQMTLGPSHPHDAEHVPHTEMQCTS